MSIQLRSRRGNFGSVLRPAPDSRERGLSGQSNAFDYPRVRLRVSLYRLLALCGAILLLGITSSSTAQQLKVSIRVLPETGRAVIEGDCAPTTVWSFRDSYAGVMSLGSRVEALRLFDNAGAEISSRKIAPGQFQASQPASRFRYEITLAPPVQGADSARVSWVTRDRGLLMLRDLLPTFAAVVPNGGAGEKANYKTATTPVILRLSLPEGWISHANEGQNPGVEFEIPDADIAVFAVGRNLRISRTVISGVTLSLVTTGEWAFTDSEGLDLAGKTYQAHRDVFGGAPTRQATLILFPFPLGGAPDRWSAETRGNSVTLLTGKQPSRIAALARLSVPLTHEFLHFWVPNGLALTGDYDWFYEGFTIYQAARTSVSLGLLTFAEFLNALSRAYDASTGGDRDRWSLVEASSRRWTGGESSVYSKSMVIAFLYDLNVRSRSRSKRSLDDVYRNIFRAYRIPEAKTGAGTMAGQGSDGNEAAIKSLDAYSGLNDFGRLFVRNAIAMNLQEHLAPFGLKVEKLGLRTYITVSESLSRQQRDLLHELGYNDYVRSPGQRKSS